MLSVDLHHRLPNFLLDVSFQAPPGVTALFGQSGSGKTTVVNALAGLLRPDRGRVQVDDLVLFDTAKNQWLPPHRRRVGYVFQEGRLFPHLNVRHNLLYGAWFSGTTHNGDFDRIIDMLGIAPLLERRPGALSGGEKQRIAIGRALLAKPRLLLMDEPLAALDNARKAEILPYLERLRDETAIPILYVSHAVSEVARLATTVVVLEQGRMVRAGPTAKILSDPESITALGIRDASSVLGGHVTAHHDDGLTEMDLGTGALFIRRLDVPLGTRLRVRVNAQDVILSRSRPEGLSALNILPCRVTALRPEAGPDMLCQLASGAQSLLARITTRSARALALAPGDLCFAIVKSVSVDQADIGRERP